MTRTWPAPAFVLVAILVLNEVAVTLALAVHFVVVIFLDVRVDDCHHLAADRRHVVYHFDRVREFLRIPCKIPEMINHNPIMSPKGATKTMVN